VSIERSEARSDRGASHKIMAGNKEVSIERSEARSDRGASQEQWLATRK